MKVQKVVELRKLDDELRFLRQQLQELQKKIELKTQESGEELNSSHSSINYPKLDFPVENLFCVGSPAGIFMSLR